MGLIAGHRSISGVAAPLLASLLLFAAASPLRADQIAGPYDVEARRQLAGRMLKPLVCPAPPPPVFAAAGQIFYRPGTGNADVNELARAANDKLAAPVNEFMVFVVRTADDYMRSRPADPTRAQCVLSWLDAWASADALLSPPDRQGRYLRNWTLADLAIAYLTIRDAPDLEAASQRRVQRWFAKLSSAVNKDFRNGTERNNHLYWAALSAVAVAAISGDTALFQWGIDAAVTGLREVQSDGSLPLELARRSKALGYHVFAAQALVLVAAFADRNHIDLWHAQNGALLRLADLLVRALQDPELITRKTGYPQDTDDLRGWPSRQALSWAEPYYGVSRDSRLVPYLRAWRPHIGSARNGGDMTLAFGAELP